MGIVRKYLPVFFSLPLPPLYQSHLPDGGKNRKQFHKEGGGGEEEDGR